MTNTLQKLRNLVLTGQPHLRGVKLLLPLSALVSLAYACYFLAGIRVADATPSNPIHVAGQAVNGRVRAATPYRPASVSDVVTKALAFKAMLTTAQQQTLEQTYTTTLARRWSNLPCGSSCRNGIQFSTLTADQLAAALEVIRAAAGTVATEGADEFNQIKPISAFRAAWVGAGTSMLS